MQIKTIFNPLDYAGLFDNAVNEALDDGWRLTRRELLQCEADTMREEKRRLLYAELVKMDPPSEQPVGDPLEAVQVLARTCENAPQCEPGSCPLHDWCVGLSSESVPKDWKKDN